MSRQDIDLALFDPEIERTFRRRRREQLGLRQVIELADQGGGENDRERENNEREVVVDDRDRTLNAFAQLNLDGLNSTYALLEKMASNNYQWPTERVAAGRRIAGVHEVSKITSHTAQIASLVNTLNNQQATPHQNVNSVQGTGESCVLCNGTHRFESCPSNPELLCYVGNMNRNNNPFSNTYNLGWRQHPNFSWSNQGVGQRSNSAPQRPQFPPWFQQQQKPQTNEFLSSMESLLKEYMARNDAVIQSQAASLRNLENQVGQLANELKNRPPGTLPSNTESPKRDGKEHCKAITLRGGKTLEAPKINEKNQKELVSRQEEENNEQGN
ncbi:hypothetical protein UlMin_010130, partial [Ulmus minor]